MFVIQAGPAFPIVLAPNAWYQPAINAQPNGPGNYTGRYLVDTAMGQVAFCMTGMALR